MLQVKEKSIIEAVNKIDELDEDSLEQLSEIHVSNQEAFVGYLFSSTIDSENEMLLELLIYYFNIFSEAIANQKDIAMEKVTEEIIDDFQEEFLAVIEEYTETEDADLIDTFCNQPAMLSFFLNELSMEDEAGENLDEDTVSYLFIVGVALIGLMNRALKKA